MNIHFIQEVPEALVETEAERVVVGVLGRAPTFEPQLCTS
jgi:hypothetical protein